MTICEYMNNFVLCPRTMDGSCVLVMKSQDILLLLKLASLERLEERERGLISSVMLRFESDDRDWLGWEIDEENEIEYQFASDRYSHRNLAAMTGISKSQIGSSLIRSKEVNLLAFDERNGIYRINKKALIEFLVHGLKYVFPVVPGPLVRGIPTAFSAPVMSKHIFGTSDSLFVWPDARGKEKGQLIEPLYKTVPKAVKQDPYLYELLALIDSIRIGKPREANYAIDLLEEALS